MRDVKEIHERMIREITEERNEEMAEFVVNKRSAREAGDRKAAAALEELKAMKVDVARFETFHARLAADRNNELSSIKEKYKADPSEPSRIDPEMFHVAALNAAVAPVGVASLPPSFAAVFSTKDEQDKLSGGTGTDVPNYTCFDAWDWARGAGNGWFGSGAGSYQVWAEWGFWYWVPTSKYYGITTHNVFRGFYIVRSDDGFWTSKYARAVVSIWNNVWQYNWKGWNNVNVLDVGSDNIDVNNRFDTDRHAYYSALLGGGDWAYVRNVVGLYVYARGDGSYAELNFATGAANYLCSPHVHIV